MDAYETATAPTRAFVLHPDLKSAKTRRLPEHGLAEAVSLAAALPGMNVLGAEVVRLPRAQPGMLFGSGKVEELKSRFAALEIDLVLVDGPVSPVQQRNLEKEWGVKLLDRTGLILEIFADRARTKEGVLQVELAALHRVIALRQQLAGVIPGKAGLFQFDGGIAAQGQALFLRVEAVLPEPTLCPVGRDFQVEPASVSKTNTRLVLGAGRSFAGDFSQHGGTKLQGWGQICPVPPGCTPKSAALQWRHMTALDGLNWPKCLI